MQKYTLSYNWQSFAANFAKISLLCMPLLPVIMNIA